jgi:hypothetical protein
MRRLLGVLMLAAGLLAGCVSQPAAEAPSAEAAGRTPATTLPYAPIPSPTNTPAPVIVPAFSAAPTYTAADGRIAAMMKVGAVKMAEILDAGSSAVSLEEMIAGFERLRSFASLERGRINVDTASPCTQTAALRYQQAMTSIESQMDEVMTWVQNGAVGNRPTISNAASLQSLVDAAVDSLTVNNCGTSRGSTGPERGTLEKLGAAQLDWNKTAALIMADMNDPTLDVEHFWERTANDRVKLREVVAAMWAAIDADADAAFVAAVREDIGSYADKMTAVDAVALAGMKSDPVAMEAALSKWQSANTRRQAAMPALLKAARPYLTPAEISGWEQTLAGP